MQELIAAAENQNCAFAHYNNPFHAYADDCCISAQVILCRVAPMLTISSACALEMIERLVKE
jgi:hypothetical protein